MPIHSRHHAQEECPSRISTLFAASLTRKRHHFYVTIRTYFVSEKLSSREFWVVDKGVLQLKGLYYGQYGEYQNHLYAAIWQSTSKASWESMTPSCTGLFVILLCEYTWFVTVS